MTSFISSLEIINVIVPDSNIFLWIAAFVADAGALNPNVIKTLIASGLSTFSIKDNPVFSNGPKSMPKNFPDCPILCNWTSDKFIFVDELFAKPLRSLQTCVLFNNNLSEKFFSLLESPTTFAEILEVTSVPFFIPNSNLLSCELDSCTFKVLYWVILYWNCIKLN